VSLYTFVAISLGQLCDVWCVRTVTQVPFKGCIKDVQLGSLVKDLNENIEFKDVSPGCTEVCDSVTSH